MRSFTLLPSSSISSPAVLSLLTGCPRTFGKQAQMWSNKHVCKLPKLVQFQLFWQSPLLCLTMQPQAKEVIRTRSCLFHTVRCRDLCWCNGHPVSLACLLPWAHLTFRFLQWIRKKKPGRNLQKANSSFNKWKKNKVKEKNKTFKDPFLWINILGVITLYVNAYVLCVSMNTETY